MTEPLSPAAQAVLDAAFSAYWSAEQEAPNDEGIIAAALRAADQVEQRWRGFSHEACQEIRAIAAELEGGND